MARLGLKRIESRVAMLGTPEAGAPKPAKLRIERIRGRAGLTRRKRIMERDGYRCAHCGRVAEDHDVDHIVALSVGGRDVDSNLQLLCTGPDRCHARKTAAEASGRAWPTTPATTGRTEPSSGSMGGGEGSDT
jgi:5-methylcytosine-specific restriction protein A